MPADLRHYTQHCLSSTYSRISFCQTVLTAPRFIPACVSAIFLLILVQSLLPSSVLANNGPHGGYDNYTAACAACHRAHTAIGQQLLVRTSVYELCITCHGSSGSGANTNVVDGTYLNRVPGAPIQGIVGSPLNAGGFLYYQLATTTSSHNVQGMPSRGYEAPGTEGTGKTAPAWGGGQAVGLNWDGGAPAESTVALECTSCHDPHGSESYRILRVETSTKGWPSSTTWPVVKGETTTASQNYTNGGSYNFYDMSSWCTTCHTNYMLQSSTYNVGDGLGEITRYRHPVGYSPGCSSCHFAHGTASTMTGYAVQTADSNGSWIDNPNTVDGVAAGVIPANDSALLRKDNRGVCVECHVRNGYVVSGGCDACHESPPSTGTHLKHYSANSTASPGYGQTGNLSSGSVYTFGCGECHPTDGGQHNNGIVEVELYKSAYPTGLKALNPSSAAYTPGPTPYTDNRGLPYTLGTCSNIYCHSKTSWSSTEVSDPIVDGSGNPVRDANGNLTYQPYTVTASRQYTAMTWGSSQPLGCSGCHDNPPRSSYPQVKAGVGNSHSWIDDYGYEDLHNWNMSFAPLNCRVCHYDTVRAAYVSYTRDAMDIATLSDVPIYGAGKHVNGTGDVRFDPVNPVNYRGSFSLAGAVWNPSNKTCSNVECHLGQATPQWGLPYRWWNDTECDQCHQYRGGWYSGYALGTLSLAEPSRSHGGGDLSCSSCHSRH